MLGDGEAIPYDVLVLATGSSWPRLLDFPNKIEDVRGHVNKWRRKFEVAQHIVVVGGGAVGIELAGELNYHWPGKKVTLVHSEPLLLNDTYPERFRKEIERRLRAKGIDVLLGDRVDVPPQGTVRITTRNSVQIPDADLIVQAYGAKPNTGFLRTWDAEILSRQGTVKVDAHLEVPRHPGVFAAGDIIDWPEEKQSHKAVEHVPIVVANVLSRLVGDAPRKIYKGSPETLVIPVGKTGGAGYVAVFGGLRVFVGDCVVRKVKAQNLSVRRLFAFVQSSLVATPKEALSWLRMVRNLSQALSLFETQLNGGTAVWFQYPRRRLIQGSLAVTRPPADRQELLPSEGRKIPIPGDPPNQCTGEDNDSQGLSAVTSTHFGFGACLKIKMAP
ncbi:hypothetical protein NUW54_g12261 [Trametes sanguinea]|uniref:Uncharacterized protein n=1 Tax=Trametes sanguinea TaxID=158606 RepID=A0ACC1N119_9APHY|nr:hypothetical protein NUW54_g12261 [Trametes sanguinea]